MTTQLYKFTKKAIELYTYNELILCYISCILIKVIKTSRGWGSTWLAQSVDYVTLNLGVESWV